MYPRLFFITLFLLVARAMHGRTVTSAQTGKWSSDAIDMTLKMKGFPMDYKGQCRVQRMADAPDNRQMIPAGTENPPAGNYLVQISREGKSLNRYKINIIRLTMV